MTVLPGELALIAACCRWPRTTERKAVVRAAAAGPIDWFRLERLAMRHRVVALVHCGLRDAGIAMPVDTERRLHRAAGLAARNALAMARETARIQIAFDAAGQPALFVKGTALAMLAYGELGIKQSWDIDVLVAPEQALAGRRVLEEKGYALVIPALDDAAFLRFVAVAKEAIFHHAELGITTELHWRLLEDRQGLAGVDARSPAQTVRLAGADIRTLEDDALFAYLCIHGTIHAWFRLKWLADLAAFLARQTPDTIERLYDAAVQSAAGRSARVALLLSHQVFGVPLPERIHRTIGQDRWARALVHAARYCLAHEAEFTPYSAPGLLTYASHFLIGRFRHVAAQKWLSAEDRSRLALPPNLTFLYGFLRVPLWAWRRLRGRVAG